MLLFVYVIITICHYCSVSFISEQLSEKSQTRVTH